MDKKKSFKVYYLLISEGTTEFNLFGYLTTKKFKKVFEESNIQFSIKVEIIKDGRQMISQGKLGGAGNIGDFKTKYTLVKDKYPDQKLFFMLDKDLEDSLKIGDLIKRGGDIIQFVEYNSEYLLLKFAGKDLKKPSDFKNLGDFRNVYCKSEFKKQFKKDAPDFKDDDFDSIFNNVSDEEIKRNFAELFSTLLF
jgi:hypothetical protein